MAQERLSILLDTNVWVDYFLPWQPKADVVEQLMSSILENGHALLYPVHALKDAFYLISARTKQHVRKETGGLSEKDTLAIRTMAWSCVNNMREVASAVGADESDVWLACKYRSVHNDLEDDLVLAAIQRAHPDFLVTNDEVLLRKATVEAHTPEDALALLEMP